MSCGLRLVQAMTLLLLPHIVLGERKCSAKWLAAAATMLGTACFCIDLYTGKESRYERMDVMGTMEPENLPGWARHGLTAIQQEQAQKKTNKERER